MIVLHLNISTLNQKACLKPTYIKDEASPINPLIQVGNGPGITGKKHLPHHIISRHPAPVITDYHQSSKS